MSEEMLKEQKEQIEEAAAETAGEQAAAAPAEPAESMADYGAELEKSYQEYDKKNTRAFTESESPDAEKWEELRQMMEDKTVVSVKIKEIVKGGAIAYVNDRKAFIPASQISLSYVEKLEDWVGKHIDTYIITVDPEKKRLVLSAREYLKARREEERKARLAAFKAGDVVEGVVESLKDYGAFVKLDEGVTGLLHVSQISRQRVKHPADVLSEGQQIKVKIRDTADGKISLSMKALEEGEDKPARAPREGRERREGREGHEPREDKSDFHYKNSAPVTTGLGDILKGLKID